MAFLSVSGLESKGEEDALSRLLSGTQNSATGGTSRSSVSASASGLEEALRKTQAEMVFHEKPPTTGLQAATSGANDALRAPDQRRRDEKAPAKAVISNRSGPSPTPLESRTTPATPIGKSLATAPEQGNSGFRADNPEDASELPAIADFVHPKLVRPLQDTMSIDQLTRIQKLSWKAMVNRDVDVIVRSETGSGKTLAYALPTLHAFLQRCDAEPITRDYGTAIIVMCPTRELVLQVSGTLTTLLRCAQFITVGGIHGGDNRHKEKARLRKGLTVLITTPGRLLDHLKTTSAFKLDNMQTIIMDEADRLLDMGFEKAVREIMEILLHKCQQPQHLKRALVSATVTDAVERLSHFALRPHVVRVGETEDTYTIPSTLRQHCMSVPVKHRLAVLLAFLRSQLDAGATKIVVFTSTADAAEFLYYMTSRLESPFLPSRQHGKVETRPKTSAQSTKKMVELANRHLHGESDEVVTFDDDADDDDASEDGKDERGASGGTRGIGGRLLSDPRRSLINANVFKLHGNMTQIDRSSVFRAFKTGSGGPTDKSVLFCTDVAARGLDMPRVDWIVHYDPPADPTSYIHRVGRTARIGNSGDSILFLAPYEMGYAQYLTNFIHTHGQSEKKEREEMTQRKYESFLFYLTKLDPRSRHMWVQSTATLERGIAQLVMQKKGHTESEYASDSAGAGSGAESDDLGRIALFAYQSYIRAYAGMPKAVKALFFDQSNLHLGHVANSFGINRSPTELQRQLRSTIREDHTLSRDNRKGTTSRDAMESRGMKRQRIEIEHDSRYHSMIAQKQRKTTRDWAEKRREESNRIKPHQFTEFDA